MIEDDKPIGIYTAHEVMESVHNRPEIGVLVAAWFDAEGKPRVYVGMENDDPKNRNTDKHHTLVKELLTAFTEIEDGQTDDTEKDPEQ